MFYTEESKIKRVISIFLVLLTFSAAVFAKTQPAPVWMLDKNADYPEEDFITAVGMGKEIEQAKSDAVGKIATYLKSEVRVSFENVYNSNNGDETLDIKRETEINSQVVFYGLEYTEPFFVKKEKTYYVLAFINREKFWNEYKSQVADECKIFTGFVDRAKQDSEPLSQIKYLNAAWTQGQVFLQKLDYGKMIYKPAAQEFGSERDLVNTIPSYIAKIQKNCSVFVTVEGDYSNILYNAVVSVLKASGLIVEKDASKATYLAECAVLDNVSGSDPLSVLPSFEMNFSNKEGKNFYNFTCEAEDKTVSFELDTARKKAYPKLAEQIKSIPSDFYAEGLE